MTPARPVLMTDSCCDLPAALVAELGVEVLPFPFTLDGAPHSDDLGASLSHAAFFRAMRAGSTPTTAQIPVATYIEAFRRHAAAGRPVVHLSFSSELSGTFDAALLALGAVREEFPGADVRVVDTRCASIGEGLLVLLAARKLAEGASAEELAAFAEAERGNIVHCFTVETLEHLRRGGRMSDLTAAAGAMLDIKPILHINDDGALYAGRVVRGRKRSLRTLAEIAAERADDGERPTVIVAHADAPEECAALREMVAERLPAADFVEAEIGPVIGAHTGPGMVAVVVRGRR